MNLRRWMIAGLTLISLSGVADAEDRLVAFGGGPSPSNNQISLEKNMQYLQRVLADVGLGAMPRDFYFADGGTTNHSVVYQVTLDEKDEFTSRLSDVLSYDSALDERYQPTALKNLRGPCTDASMHNWFGNTGTKLHGTDHLVFYFTGHGGGDTSKATPARNTTMDMWGTPDITMRDFVQQLDKIDPAVEVTLIMVQCHSAGFANVIYVDGDPKKGIAKHRRAGFFSTTAPRLAAGCTPEMKEEDYQDFSTHFFAALSGKTRTGKPVEKPDYDQKGFTSYADAFTYVLLNDDTIDIPMTTSDQLLRDFSRARTRDEQGDLLERNASYAAVLDAGTPAQKAALEGLSTQLGLTGDRRVMDARALARQIQQQRDQLSRTRRGNESALNDARKNLREALLQRYPELGVPLHPEVPKMLAAQGAEIQKFVESLADWQKYKQASEKLDEFERKDDELERRWVKAQRFIERATSVILAANLPKVAEKDVVEAYGNLITLEGRTLKGNP